jgi:hypothetical protein
MRGIGVVVDELHPQGVGVEFSRRFGIVDGKDDVAYLADLRHGDSSELRVGVIARPDRVHNVQG